MQDPTIDPVATLEAIAAERKATGAESDAAAIVDFLARHSLLAAERDALRVQLGAVPTVDIVPNDAGCIVATIKGRGSDIVARQSEADSRTTAATALGRLTAAHLIRSAGG